MKKRVILISGKMQSGKNQMSKFLKELLEQKGYSVSEDMFAKGVKDGCKEDFKELANVLNRIASSLELNYGDGIADDLRIVDDNWYENKTAITRALLQAYGTEIFRNRVDNDWWVKQLKKRILESPSDIVLVTDVRFPNEIDKMDPDNQEYDLIAVRVERNTEKHGNQHEHPSETALDNYNLFNYYLDNDGTLDDLRTTVSSLVDEIETDFQMTKENVVLGGESGD